MEPIPTTIDVFTSPIVRTELLPRKLLAAIVPDATILDVATYTMLPYIAILDVVMLLDVMLEATVKLLVVVVPDTDRLPFII